MDYCIWVKGEPVKVSEAVYRTYWRGARKEKYFMESDIHNKTFSYDALDTEGINGCDIFCGTSTKTTEDQVLDKFCAQDLGNALSILSDTELELIRRLYLYDESLRSIAKVQNISPSTLQYRHQKILSKLRKQLLKNGGITYE